MSFCSFIGALLIAVIGLVSALLGAGSLPQFNDFFFQRMLCQIGFGERVLRHHYATFNPSGYISNPLLDREIIHALTSNQRGVRVLSLPFGAGKTTAVERVLAQLQAEDKISGVLPVTDLHGIPPEKSLVYSAFSYLHLDPSTQISHYLPDSYIKKPLVLLFDQFERAQYQKLIRPFTVALAEESRKYKKFVVLLVSTDPVFTKAILGWNGGEKISKVCRSKNASVYRWSYEQLSLLFDEEAAGSVENRDELLQLAVQAGTPGFLVSAVDNHVEAGTLTNLDDLKQDTETKNRAWDKFSF